MKPDRAKNIEIILRRMKLEKNFESLEEAFLVYDPVYTSEDMLISLQNILPTSKEKA